MKRYIIYEEVYYNYIRPNSLSFKNPAELAHKIQKIIASAFFGINNYDALLTAGPGGSSEEPTGGGYKPDGMLYSLSFDFAFGGGAGIEIGLVTDNNGGKQWFVSFNANIGYGISAGPNVRTINSIPGSTFKASDYLGYSAGFSAGLFEVGGFYGGNKSQWDFTDFRDFGDTYNENGLGISKIKGPIWGAWWSNTNTKKLFGNEKKD